jgi:glyoxylase-like metal-dependent hydrolase (beta-lactamase superfamily II)
MLTKLILSHSHVDHRGAASELGVPIYCHPAEVRDAENDGGRHYIDWSLVSNPAVRDGLPQLHDTWDGGPVAIAGTVDEDTEMAEFRVVHLPGHAPGLIGLYRDADGVALAPDVVYTLDAETGEGGAARVPHPAFNWDTERARASIKKLRDLRPATVWTGHGDHLSGDVVAQLDLAASWNYPLPSQPI